MPVALAVALVVATFVVYAPAAANDFVSFDDPDYIVDNPGVNGGLSPSSVAWAFTAFHSSNWHPLTWLSHQLDVTLFGLDAGKHHVMGVGLHALSAALCFAFLFLATRAPWRSAWVAALFALHPLRVESVAWASERKDVLAGLFFWLTLLAYVRYARRPGRTAYLVTLSFFALGLLSKPMLVTLPFVLLLLDRWPLDRWPHARWNWSAARGLLLEKLPFMLLVVASALVTLRAQSAGRAVRSLAELAFAARIANAFEAFWTYVVQLFAPHGLAFFHPHPALVDADWTPWGATTTVPLVLLVLCSGVAWQLRKRRPVLIVGWCWFVGMLLPVIGILQVGEQAWAERYAYLPLVGLTIALAWSVPDRARWPAAVLGVVSVGACAVSTHGQIATWRDSGTLYEHALAVTDDNYRAHLGLGNVRQRAGDARGAAIEYGLALEIRPDYAPAYFNRGLASQLQGDEAEAIADFESAIACDPRYEVPYLNLSELLVRAQRFDEAEEVLDRLLARNPDEPNAHYNLGLVHLARADASRALEHLANAARLAPGTAQFRHALGSTLSGAGRRAEALPHLRAACDLAVAAGGTAPAAVELAWLLATAPEEELRDQEEALRWAGYALDTRAAGSLETMEALAAALANAGRFPEAVEWQQKAVDRAPIDRRGTMRQRLLLYQDGKPFRDTP